MISRQTRETAGGVLSFTFLDVLTCTMGCLVLLVVVLGEKAANTRLEDALRSGPRKSSLASTDQPGVGASPTIGLHTDPTSATSNREVASQLAELRKQEVQLKQLRGKAITRLDEELARVSHLEDHQRRLEHELAQLHITLERLNEAEKKQTVDQASAERDLTRLTELIADTERRLQELRDEPAAMKSYAIMPYEGKNGTHRRPIYIECTADSVTIQPEGIKLSEHDFDGPIRSGNPLASAVRAAREELNARARAAGDAEMPDAYPLILIRPDAALTYRAVAAAVESWDVQYGYELIDADWKLEYPEPDARLGQVMAHAVDQARQRQALLAKAAPRTYGAASMLPRRDGSDAASAGRADRGRLDLDDANSTGSGGGNAIGGSQASSLLGEPARPTSSNMNFVDEVAAADGQTHYGQINSGADGRQQAAPDEYAAAGGTSATPSPTDATPSFTPSSTPSGVMSASGATSAASPAPDVHQSPSETSDPGEAPPAGNLVQAMDRNAAASAAETRGANWANVAATQRAAPVTRPIRVLVSPEELNLLAEDDGSGGSPSGAVSFHQPTDNVLDELAEAVQQHIEGWGLAGKAMYWRPMLVLQVAPGAERHAIRLNDLLRDSGVDVRFQEVASRTEEEAASATR